MEDNIEGWQNLVATLAEAARQHPQTAYAGLQKSLHKECVFTHCVTLCIGMEFQPVEDELWDTSLPDLFKGGTSQIPGRSITSLPVNQDGIALTNPTHTTGANCTVSCVVTGHLVAALRGTAEFSLGDHALLMGEVREEIRWRHAEVAETAL